MLPEISRRCLSCGAAVRAGSRFCQQCGKGLEAEARPGASGGLEEVRASVPPTGERALPAEEPAPTKDWTPPTKEFAAFEQASGASGVQAAASPPEQVPAAAAATTAAAAVEPEPVVGSAPTLPEEAGPAAEEAGPAAEEAGPAAEEAGEVVEAGRAGDLRGRVARVREETRARVGRMREEAIVVLEETPDDSGLRFVIVAAALFIIFLVLLFLSTTILR